MKIHQLTRISLFSALMIVFTIVFPSIMLSFSAVPFTLQTFVMMLCGIILSPYEAFFSMFTYLLIGAIGIPVFSSYHSGLQTLVGPTGGFLIAFPLAAFLISYFKKDNHFNHIFLATLLFGIGFVYLVGVLVLSLYLKTPYLATLQTMDVFIIFDLIKAIVASYLGVTLNKYLKKFKSY